MAAVQGLIVNEVNFNFSCFVHNNGFCFLHIWFPTLLASSGRRVLLKFGLQNTSSYKVLKKMCNAATAWETTNVSPGERMLCWPEVMSIKSVVAPMHLELFIFQNQSAVNLASLVCEHSQTGSDSELRQNWR